MRIPMERKKVDVEVGQVGRRLNSLGFLLPNLFRGLGRLGRLGHPKRKQGTLVDALPQRQPFCPASQAIITSARISGIAIHVPHLSNADTCPTVAT